MSDMKIYVANLRAYNEGHLKGDWFDLPVEMSEVFEKVFEPHELDENGQPQTDWAIHDYELPFQVSEYESIDKLNQIAEDLQNMDSAEPILSGHYDMEDVINFANELGKEEIIEDVVGDERINEMVQSEIEDGNWAGVKIMLQHADANSDLHLIDGYDNIVRLPDDHAESVVSQLMDELQNDFGEVKQRSFKKERNNALER